MEDNRKTTSSQRIAAEKWASKNKEKKRYINEKSHTKKFLTQMAKPKDLEFFKQIINRVQLINGGDSMTFQIELTANNGQTYETTFEMAPLTDDNTEIVRDKEVARTLVDVFSTHPDHGEYEAYSDGDVDLDSSLEAYYNDDDLITDDNVKKWFKKVVQPFYPDIEITSFSNETEYLNS